MVAVFCRPYLAVGLYAVFLEVWWRYFPKDQIMVIRAEDYYKDSRPVLARLFRFAELPEPTPNLWQSLLINPVSNQGVRGLPMLDQTRELLEAFYQPHTARLDTLLGETKSRHGL